MPQFINLTNFAIKVVNYGMAGFTYHEGKVGSDGALQDIPATLTLVSLLLSIALIS